MKSIGLARYFSAKYAGNEDMTPDTSLGAPVNAAKAQLLKERLILIYGKLTSGITKLPAFVQINKEMQGNQQLVELNILMTHFVKYVSGHSLKDCFGYSVKLIDQLNKVRNEVKGMPREKIFELENAIKSIQDNIWEESKRILNLHNLRGVLLDFPEDVRSKVNELVPTWDFGPGKNPAYKKINVRKYETPRDVMKRLMRENEQEEAAKKKGK